MKYLRGGEAGRSRGGRRAGLDEQVPRRRGARGGRGGRRAARDLHGSGKGSTRARRGGRGGRAPTPRSSAEAEGGPGGQWANSPGVGIPNPSRKGAFPSPRPFSSDLPHACGPPGRFREARQKEPSLGPPGRGGRGGGGERGGPDKGAFGGEPRGLIPGRIPGRRGVRRPCPTPPSLAGGEHLSQREGSTGERKQFKEPSPTPLGLEGLGMTPSFLFSLLEREDSR